ncbi:MAG TPA: glycosyltransferase family 87 protein [Terriglobales bacterium]|nr:glycosyltransferase family 87 protein [Terriglobales bacterium]
MAIMLVPSTDHAHIETTDFLNFYVGATIVREGHGRTLYQAETQQLVLQSILGRRVTEYYLHPPFEAAALVPFSYLRIERAFVVWTLVNAALLGLLPLLFTGCVSFVARRPYLGLLGFAFPPVLASLTLGQDSILVLFFISAAYLLGVKKRDFVAGLVLALATFKFQYVLILALLLLVSRKFRFIGGFVAGCAVLALASVLVTGGSGIIEYFRFVHRFDLHNGYGNVNPAAMMNWRGFLAGIGWEDNRRLYSTIGSAILIALGIVSSRWIRATKNQQLGFSLYVAIALAASPYNYFQDAAILLLAIFLVMDLVVRGRIIGIRAKLVIVCCVLMFVWPVVLLIFGGHYFWNSRIYLVFPVIICFICVLAAELYSQNAVLPAPAARCG